MAEIVYLDSYEESDILYSSLSQPVRDWFKDKFPDFTDPQKMAIPSISNGDNLLLCSPTGSGKTLTAFLSIIDKLVRMSLDGELEDKVYCVYISPIKALANDIQKNLIDPLTEIKDRFLPKRAKDIKVGLRTGDTSQSERQKMLRKPPHILITTPESLGLALASSKFRPLMNELSWLVLDELHSLVPSKRGTLLSLTVALLDSVILTPVQRIGISATMEPLDEVARFLVPVGGEQDSVKVAKVSGARELDLDIILPHPRFGDPTFDHKQILDANVENILDLIEAHTTTIVFVNTRKMTEEIVQKIRRLAGWDDSGIEAHHGSMNKQIRKDVEERLKMGELRCCVSSSSLELGIDIGTVDLVIQLGSPGSIATALQRIGRAGHHVGGIPRARLLPTGPHDLVELVALQGAIMSGEMDLLRFPENSLDVLAQFMVGLTIVGEQDVDEVYGLITNAWPYRSLPYDDYIEVIDMLEDEKRLWVDWEENTIGKRGYSQMIYYTNLGTISPDNNYLVLNTDGSMIGQLSSSFVSSVRPGDVILLGGTTYRIQSIQGSRVNVTPVTGYRPTVPSWSGEALSRSSELSDSVLKLQKATMLALRRQRDPRRLLKEGYGLSSKISEAVARFMEQHVAESFEVPGPNRIMMEQIVGGGTTYMVTTCRGRAFNMTLGYFFAGIASAHEIQVYEISFDENGFLIKLSDDVDPAAFPAVFESGDHRKIIESYLIDTQLFAKRFREVAGRSLIIPRRIGAEEVSPQQFQQKSDALFKSHRAASESLLMKEVFNEIFHHDLDMIGLDQFVSRVVDGSSRILHTRVKVPSPIGMNLYMSAFEDLLSMRTRAYLIKDIDPEILRRLLGQRALATQLDEGQVNSYYEDKMPTPNDSESLLDLMEMGGGLDRKHINPLYRSKLEGIDEEEIRGWVLELIEKEEIVRINNTGHEGIDNKWFSRRMGDIHGTLGLLSTHNAEDIDDLRQLYTGGLTYDVSTKYKGTEAISWKASLLSDPHECLRVKMVDLLGSEGPQTLDDLVSRLPFPKQMIENILHELEVRNIITIGFYRQTEEGEFILRVDEHYITGGEEDVIAYRNLQNLLLTKSFKLHDDPLQALSSHVMIQKMHELLDRVKSFRFADWKDLKHDPDVVMGRLLHNRVGYTKKDQLPLLLGLRPEPWIGEMESKLLTNIPENDNVTRQQVLIDIPRDEESKYLMNRAKYAINNMERQLLCVKQYEELPERKRSLSLFHRVKDVYNPIPFDDALVELIRRIGPVKRYTLGWYVSRSGDELDDTLRLLLDQGRITKVIALQPELTDFYCLLEDVSEVKRRVREDREMRILTQSDPFCSRFIQEVRYVLKQGWYYPVFKGVDPVGRILMYKVNDYLEIKDIHIPHAYLDEFVEKFDRLLENYRDTLVEISVLTNFNGENITEARKETKDAFARIGFKGIGDGRRLIRGGVMDPRPVKDSIRVLFNNHHMHQHSRSENETIAVKMVNEIRDDFALRGRCESYRVDLKSMASANQLHQGTNLTGHRVYAPYSHFQKLLTIRNLPPDEELLDVLEFFTDHSDPQLFMDRHALRRSEFRKLAQPLIRSGHLVQDYRGGFRTVHPTIATDHWQFKQDYLIELIKDIPVITMKQCEKMAGKPYMPEEIMTVLQHLVDEGEFIKGFLLEDLNEVCWGRKDMLESASGIEKMRDFVLPPSDPLAPYFAKLLRERFGFGSAYLVFYNEEPIAAFKANTRENIIDVTDLVSDPKLEKEALRVIKEFAWEHQMPLRGKIIDKIKRR
ncbi:MAG: hypothetical protein CMA77_03255 [Euryarchaeota archaeon]|nr:hypothetical protein [Euryarchaeota archaeon]